MRKTTILSLLAFALLAGACMEDDDGVELGPGGDTNGTWVVQRSSGTMYVRILPNAVELYEQSDTCFLKTDYLITGIDGPSFTVQLVDEEDDTPPSFAWSFERIGDVLAVQIRGQAMTLQPADIDLGAIPVCGGSTGDFPHPPCGEIPAIAVGGSVTESLGDGDTQWSDGTWYDLWSLQLDAPTSVTIAMTSDDIDLLDPYLLFYDATGVERIDENDDADYDGGNYNSRIGPLALEAGCYIIVAGSWQGDDSDEVGGGYSLSVQ